MRSELLERGEVIEGVVKLLDTRKAAEVRFSLEFWSHGRKFVPDIYSIDI